MLDFDKKLKNRVLLCNVSYMVQYGVYRYLHAARDTEIFCEL